MLDDVSAAASAFVIMCKKKGSYSEKLNRVSIGAALSKGQDRVNPFLFLHVK